MGLHLLSHYLGLVSLLLLESCVRILGMAICLDNFLPNKLLGLLLQENYLWPFCHSLLSGVSSPFFM